MQYTAKMFAAIVGGSAVVTLGALSASIVGSQTAPASAAGSPAMTTGATITETTPPNVEAVQEAKPSIKGPAPLPSEDQGLPG